MNDERANMKSSYKNSFSRARAVVEQAKAQGGRVVHVNVSALTNQTAETGNKYMSGSAYRAKIDSIGQSAGPKKRAFLIEDANGRRLQFTDGTTFENPRPGAFRAYLEPVLKTPRKTKKKGDANV